MWLKDKVTAAANKVRKYPAARASLDAAAHERELAGIMLEQREAECALLRAAAQKDRRRLESAECRASAFMSAQREVCPQLSGTEEMKRLYEALAPSLDAGGFTLYRMAERLTGETVYSLFPYEDAHGAFEELDGRRLLEYLTAGCFHGVEWQVVPGGCVERAVLREVDASTPEYQEFERQLYENVLTHMGFEELIAPGMVMEPESAAAPQVPGMVIS